MKSAIEKLALYNLAEDFWLQRLKGVTFNPIFGRQDQEKKPINIFELRSISFSPQIVDSIGTVSGESDTNTFLI
ncbi:MAG TPA: hypothetical protein VK186_11070, partial [Candidatus Deferrimicrobium sp.]|nr:hypothetical protein [Candidatus Deferrimicrobium sp.]